MSLDAIFSNGVVLTQDPIQPTAEALGLVEGRITAVGSKNDLESLCTSSTRRIDLEGGALLPGFNDAHVHVWKLGQLLTSMADLRGVTSLEALGARLRQASAELVPGQWLLGRGFNEAEMHEHRQPTRIDLDRVMPDRPVALTRTCGHMMVANSRALELAGIDDGTEAPPGGEVIRNDRGEATGLLTENAMGLMKAVIPSPTLESYREMVLAATRHQLELGITSATDAGCYPDLLEAYRQLDRERRLPLRINAMAMGLRDGEPQPIPLPEKYLSDWLRIDSIKLFADGGLSGATAALKAPYRHQDTTGLLRLDREQLWALAESAHEAGLRVCTHAIGDAAIDEVLSVYERLCEKGSEGHRIEHFGLPEAGHIQRASRIGTIIAPQTIFIHSLGPNFRRYLRNDYLVRAYPVRSMLAAGLTVALSSDAPVVPDDNPLVGIVAAIGRRDREGVTIGVEERIALSQALFAYTAAGAQASGDFANRGCLSVGKWADLVWLSSDPRSCPAESLPDIRVRETWVAGVCRYQA